MNQKGYIRWIIFIVFLVGVLAFIYTKSQESLPGDLIYPLKGVKEGIGLAMNELNYEGRASRYMEHSFERFDEAMKLIELKRDENDIKQALENLSESQERALDNFERARVYGTSIVPHLEKFEGELTKQQEVLFELLFQVSPSLYDSIKSALQKTEESIETVRYMKVR